MLKKTLFFAQYFDFFGMFAYLVLALELSLPKKLSKKLSSPGLLSLLLLPFLCGLTVVFAHLHIPYQLIVLLLIVSVLALNVNSLSDKNLSASLGFIVVAAAFSAAG